MPERAFQELGEVLTKALTKGDFALYRSIIDLPMRITPRDGKTYVLGDEAALRKDFALYAAIIKLHGVTDIYRKLLQLEPVPPDLVRVGWMTHILVRANLLVEPFATQMLFRKGADGWRIAEVESTVGHLHWTQGRAVVSPEDTFDINEGEA